MKREKTEQIRKEEGFYYLCFVLGYDLLQNEFSKLYFDNCDNVFNISKKIINEFYNSKEFKDFTKSEYDALCEFVKTDKVKDILEIDGNSIPQF